MADGKHYRVRSGYTFHADNGETWKSGTVLFLTTEQVEGRLHQLEDSNKPPTDPEPSAVSDEMAKLKEENAKLLEQLSGASNKMVEGGEDETATKPVKRRRKRKSKEEE